MANILWDFQIQTDRQLLANQPDIIVVDKDKLEKYQTLKGELERMWKVNANVILVVVGALQAVTFKMEERLPETSVQKSSMLGTTKILCKTLQLPGLCSRN